MADFEIERPSVETNQVSPTFNVNIPQFTIEVQGGVQGQRGEKGDPGEPGAPNILSIGTVVSGDTANASITGTTPNQVLNLVLPQGEDGQDGQDGEDGVGIESVEQTTTSTEDEGNNIVTVTLTDGTTSTFTVQNGSKGSTGATGAQGPAGADGAKGDTGVGVESIEQTTTSHESGGTNIITATLTDGTTSEFYIKNGEAGGGGGGGTSNYNDLTNKPSINNVTLTGNKTTSDLGINIPTATSDLTNDSGFITSSSLPTKVSDLTNDAGYITSYTETDPVFTASAASGITSTDITNWNNKSDFSGSYNDLTNKPTIPTVNNAKLTIQKNGTTVKTFTANASSNVTANITVPTTTNELTNDSGYITKSVSDLTNYTPTSSLATVATSGSYNDLSNTPTIPTVPTNISAFTNDSGYITGITSSDIYNVLGYYPAAEPNIYAYNSIRQITSTSDQTYIDLIDDITNHRPIIIRLGMLGYANVLGTYYGGTAILWFNYSDNSCTTITLIDEGSSVDVQVEKTKIPTKTSDLRNDSNFAVTNANNNFSSSQSITGDLIVSGTAQIQNGLYCRPTGQADTPVGNSMLVIKRVTNSEAPNNGVVLEFGNSTSWAGQLYIGDNATQGIYYNGWSDGVRGSWIKLATQNDLAKNIITMQLTSTQSFGGAYTKINLSARTIIGTKLSVSSNQVKIGAGVNHIKVSGTLAYNKGSTGYKYMRLTKNFNTSNLDGTSITMQASNESNQGTAQLTASEIICNVTEGDLIGMHVYGGNGDSARPTLSGNMLQTYMTVEVVD